MRITVVRTPTCPGVRHENTLVEVTTCGALRVFKMGAVIDEVIYAPGHWEKVTNNCNE